MWRLGRLNSSPGTRCCMTPRDRKQAAYHSLWVFYFYLKRRPVFYEELVGKEKGQLEGLNVIRFRWPGETARWLERVKEERPLP